MVGDWIGRVCEDWLLLPEEESNFSSDPVPGICCACSTSGHNASATRASPAPPLLNVIYPIPDEFSFG